MERHGSSRSSSLWLSLVVVLAACGPSARPPTSTPTGASVVVPYKVAGGGEIRFTVKPRYTVGGPVMFDLDISAGDAQILGPLSGVVLQSDLAGEQTIRRLAPSEVPTLEVAPGQHAHATVAWDGKRDDGYDVPAATYSLALDFIIGGANARLGTILELRAP